MSEKLKLFLFSSSLLSDQGGSSHTKSLMNELMLSKENVKYYTYDDIGSNNHILRMLGFGSFIIAHRKSISAFYIRYTPLVFLVLLIGHMFSNSKGFVELNAYLPEELQERKQMSRLKRWLLTIIFKLDLSMIRKLKVSVIAVTKEMKDELNFIGIKSYWLPNGAPTSQQKVATPSKLSDRVRVCFIGSIEPWQDYKLIAALPMHLAGSQVIINVVGEGSCLGDFKHEVCKLNINEKFVFHGYQSKDRVKEIVKQSDICIAPLTGSRLKKTGASPLKVLEYLSWGKPVVTTDCGSNKHIINQHTMISFAPAGNHRAFAAELTKLVARYSSDAPETKEEMERNAKILDLFSWRNVFSKIITIMDTSN